MSEYDLENARRALHIARDLMQTHQPTMMQALVGVANAWVAIDQAERANRPSVCGATPTDKALVCALSADHQGDHMACTGPWGNLVHVWRRTTDRPNRSARECDVCADGIPHSRRCHWDEHEACDRVAEGSDTPRSCVCDCHDPNRPNGSER